MSMVMPVTVEERDADRNRRGPKETFFNSNMYFYGREICFILAVIITSYAALQNAPPKISKSPSPVPFFPRTSLVADFYHGQLSPAFERVSESDVSFVMYYAPWDAESQATRAQFKTVAQYYYKQVYFAAINCWQPHSECRQQFSKVQQFPVLIVYTQHNKGIQYKGVREAAHMIRFLQFVLRPLERINNIADIIKLMDVYDALVVGCFDFAGNIGGPGYYTFYSTALKFLERDPHREVGFAVVTNMETGRQLGIEMTPTVRIYMWNETLQYSHYAEYAPDVLVKWIAANTHQISVWVSPPGVKSLTLAPYVEDGSVLILFTPRNPLQDQNHNYNMLREIGLEYYNCDNNPWVFNIANHLANQRAELKKKYSELEAECLLWKEQRRSDQDIPPIQVVGSQWTNGSCCNGRTRKKLCSICERHSAELHDKLDDTAHLNVPRKCKKNDVISPSSHLKYGPFTESHHEYYVCCKHDNTLSQSSETARFQTSLLTGLGDERSAASLQEASSLERCRRLRRARVIHHPIFPHPAYHRKSPRHFTGLACSTNKTMSLIAMDSLQFHQFAEGLGIDVLARRDKTAVVIFNVLQESSYVLDTEFSKGAVLEFITNYTDGLLNRSLRSSSGPPHGALNHYPEQNVEDCQEGQVVCIPELNSDSFHRVVMAQNKAVVVLYHSPYCTFCHGISHIYLTAARYFRAVRNLTFARIDGENNDLPWEFTMHHYPTILFFPAQRKSESRVFPRNLPITVPNMVNFVLSNLDPEEGSLRGMIGLCAGWGTQQDSESARDCIARVRRESLTAISNTLKQFRSTKTRWHIFEASSSLDVSQLRVYRTEAHKQLKKHLYRLQHLKEIHLILGSVDRLLEDSREYAAIQDSYERYHNSVKNIYFHESLEVMVPASDSAFVRDEL
ncbi:thioredoxin domain-containing protein 11 [Periplaneta americana]|uniref:thioredoxin domain-containing protein 11 n=1 Tax=Periplaneta americana TaxID=6978 RepID=UPI0037E94F38